MNKVQPHQVVSTADLAVKPCLERLVRDISWLHENGYHQWSASVGNLHTKIERAFIAFVDEMVPDA